jgi:hypothetical protein
MIFSTGFIFALAILVAVTGHVARTVIACLFHRGEGGPSATSRLAKMEERISKMEEATSGLVAEFAAVRERERFMTQLVESRARKDARNAAENAAENAAAVIPAAVIPPSGEGTSPFVVQTVSAARRVIKPGG